MQQFSGAIAAQCRSCSRISGVWRGFWRYFAQKLRRPDGRHQVAAEYI